MKKQHLHAICSVTALFTVAAIGLGLAVYRAKSAMPLLDDAALLAGKLSFVNGSADVPDEADQPAPTARPRPHAETPTQAEEAARPKNTVHTGEPHPVVEISGGDGNLSFENIEICNGTDYTLDVGSILNSDLPFEIEDNRAVQVLVYHTHTCESYLDEDDGVYYDDFYPRSTDPEQGVMAVGERLVETLRANGIGAVHDTTLHDYPSYEGSYARSWETVCKYGEKYPRLKITIDLHRDSMTSSDGTKYKPVFEHDGQKAAQIMIMTGRDTDGDFDFWDENLIFALQLQKKCEDLYPGMTRPLDFDDYTYNMNYNNGSLLIEVGTDANTVEETKRTGEYLANALSSLLLKE